MDGRAIAPLLRFIKIKRGSKRVAAVGLLQMLPMTNVSNTELSELRQFLDDKNSRIVVGIIKTLVKQRDTLVFGELKRLTNSRSPEIQEAAAKGIAELRRPARRGICENLK
jgi:hypothetical protein